MRKNSHISDCIRAALKKQPPEIRRGVLAVADADVGGRSVTPAAHAPYVSKRFLTKRITTDQVPVKRPPMSGQ
jgi:hypothetical protein